MADNTGSDVNLFKLHTKEECSVTNIKVAEADCKVGIKMESDENYNIYTTEMLQNVKKEKNLKLDNSYVKMPITYLGDSILRMLLSDVYGYFKEETSNGKISCDLCVEGQLIRQLIRRLKASKKEKSKWHRLNTDTCVVMIGTSNLLRKDPTKKIIKLFKTLMRHVHAKYRRIVVCTLPPLIENVAEVAELNKEIKKYSVWKNITIVDYFAAMRQLQYDGLSGDGVHPNLDGLQTLTTLLQDHLNNC